MDIVFGFGFNCVVDVVVFWFFDLFGVDLGGYFVVFLIGIVL